MAADTLFQRITDYAHRADPYPLYAELRESRVARQEDGSYLVGTYHEIAALLHDPRVSSDRRNRTAPDETGRIRRAGRTTPKTVPKAVKTRESRIPGLLGTLRIQGTLDGGECEAEIAETPGKLGEYGAGRAPTARQIR